MMAKTLSKSNSAVLQKKRQQKKEQEWTYECNKLNKRYDVIEKQLQSIYRDGNPLSLEFKDIFDWKQLMHSERIKKSKELQNELLQTSALVNEFCVIVNNINHSRTKNNEQYIEKMNLTAEKLEDKLMEFKTNHDKQLKELENAENILWTELCTTKERLHTFENDVTGNLNNKNNNDHSSDLSSSSSIKTVHFAKKRKLNDKISNKFGVINDSRPPQLIKIQQQIDEHGPYGGWPERDHNDFLKLYAQIPSDRKLLHRLSEVMPQYTLSELREHLEWFDQYERLWEQKRVIIHQYKLKQKHEKKIKQTYEAKQEEVDIEYEKKKKLEIKLGRENKKKLIAEWRKEKERKEMETLKKKEQEMKRKKLKSQKEYKQRVKESKKLLIQLAEQKKLNELIEKQKSIQNKNRHIKSMKRTEKNQDLLIKFRTKDMLLVERKKNAINKLKQKEQDREWKLVNLIAKSQPNINVKKDPSRLLKMTTSTKKRMDLKKQKENKKNDKNRLYVSTETIATRSVPSWRRGLN